MEKLKIENEKVKTEKDVVGKQREEMYQENAKIKREIAESGCKMHSFTQNNETNEEKMT